MNIVQRLIDNKENFTKGRQGKTITAIVLHTEGASSKIDKTEDRSLYTWFNTNSKRVSAHYFVTFSGKVEQYVLDQDTAHHAGNWNFNLATIGIEHQDNGYWDTGERYTESQYEASAQLVANLCLKYSITCEHTSPESSIGIKIHKEVPGASTGCPDALDWNRIITRAQEIMAKEMAEGCRSVLMHIIEQVLSNLMKIRSRASKK